MFFYLFLSAQIKIQSVEAITCIRQWRDDARGSQVRNTIPLNLPPCPKAVPGWVGGLSKPRIMNRGVGCLVQYSIEDANQSRAKSFRINLC